jgi:hypothetical protein
MNQNSMKQWRYAGHLDEIQMSVCLMEVVIWFDVLREKRAHEPCAPTVNLFESGGRDAQNQRLPAQQKHRLLVVRPG